MRFSRDWEWGKGSNPGGLVVSGSLPKEQSPAAQLLLSGLREPIAVIQGSHVDPLLPQLMPLLLACLFSLQAYSPFSWVRSTVAPSYSIQSSMFKVKATVTSSPASRSSKAVAESSSMLTPLSSCLFGRVSWVSELVGFLNNNSNFFDQSISRFRAQNHRSPRTRSHALIGTTSTSNSSTGARCFKYWTEIVVFWLSFACPITWLLRPRVVVQAAWCRSLSLWRSLGVIKMLVALQSIGARTLCILPCLSRICTSWIMCAESGVSVTEILTKHVGPRALQNNLRT